MRRNRIKAVDPCLAQQGGCLLVDFDQTGKGDDRKAVFLSKRSSAGRRFAVGCLGIQAAFAGEQNVGVFQVVFEPGHIQDHVDAGQKLCVEVGKECVAEPAGRAGAGGLSER